MPVECKREYDDWTRRIKKYVLGQYDGEKYSLEEFAINHPNIAPDIIAADGSYDVDEARKRARRSRHELNRPDDESAKKPRKIVLEDLFALCRTLNKKPNYFLVDTNLFDENIRGAISNTFRERALEGQNILRDIALSCGAVKAYVKELCVSETCFDVTHARIPHNELFLELFLSEVTYYLPIVFCCTKKLGAYEGAKVSYSAPYSFDLGKAVSSKPDIIDIPQAECYFIIDNYIVNAGNKKAQRILDADYFTNFAPSLQKIWWTIKGDEVEDLRAETASENTIDGSSNKKRETTISFNIAKKLGMSINMCFFFCALSAIVKLVLYKSGKEKLKELTKADYESYLIENSDVLSFAAQLLSDSFIFRNQNGILELRYGNNICDKNQFEDACEDYSQQTDRDADQHTRSSSHRKRTCKENPLNILDGQTHRETDIGL